MATDPAWRGGPQGPGVTCVLADNPSPMTLDGTNTWILDDGADAVVIDPGPTHPAHLANVQDLVNAGGLQVATIVLTHHHHDHTAAAAMFAAALDAPVRALDPNLCQGAPALVEGERLPVGGRSLRLLATPGHTRDSICLFDDDASRLFTGDTVLGRGTAVIAHPDGVLGAYLDSLDRLADVIGSRSVHVMPGHGPVLDDAAAVLAEYLAHRVERLTQVQAVVSDRAARGLGTSTQDVLEVVYADVPRPVWEWAAWSVKAQLAHLGLPVD